MAPSIEALESLGPDETMQQRTLAEAIGLEGPWDRGRSRRLASHMNAVEAISKKFGDRSNPLPFERIVNAQGKPGSGVHNQSRMVTQRAEKPARASRKRTGIAKATLVKTAKDRLEQNTGKIEREGKGPALVYRIVKTNKTVRVRTCNDHALVATLDPNTSKLNVEGTDLILIAMPQQPRTAGPITTYLVPTEAVVAAINEAHENWIAGGGKTAGNNYTPVLSFNATLRELWAKYLLSDTGTHASA